MGDTEQRPVESAGGGMRRRRATMPDGRYIIYFTFDEGPGPEHSVEVVPPEADARPDTPEERDV